jgi:response regulator RpfG family c-di-GMP phosphodiesterase
MNTYEPNTRILFVDDEPLLLATINSLFRREGLEVHVLGDPMLIDEALAEHGPFAVVISDQRMPGRDGVATLDRVRQYSPDTIRVMLTGYAEQDDTVRAINTAGISRYIAKPWDDTLLKRTVQDCVRTYNMAAENRYLAAELAGRNDELSELAEGTVGQTVELLSHLTGYINAHAARQTDRVRALGTALLNVYPALSPAERWDITRALELFNLGIAVLPPWIQVTINKEGLWSLARFPMAQNHHLLAYDLLKEIPRFDHVARIIQLSHKDVDGTGEPASVTLKGQDLPFGSRLLHILVDLDSLSTEHQRGRALLQTMRIQDRKYDAGIITLLLGLENLLHDPQAGMSVTISSLRPGMVLAEDLVTARGSVMIKTGTEITTPLLRILSQTRRYDPIKEPITVRMNSESALQLQ